eukprot:m.97792 g.97792  ORF g.97792 m.97792 type:complete len:377 (-) comp27011_c1_seq1:58-1188(-)
MMASFKTPERQMISVRTPKTTPKSASQGFRDISKQYTLLAELKQAHLHPQSGLYVCVSDEGHWDGVLFIHSGMYEGGVFRFRIVIPEKYPTEIAPLIFFQTAVFHPMVHATTGALSYGKHYQGKWRPKDKLWHLLKYVRHIFYTISVDSPLNDEAAALFQNDSAAYDARVKECIKWSNDDIEEKSSTKSQIDFNASTGMEFDYSCVLNAMLEWGETPPTNERDIARVFPQDQSSDTHDQQQQLRPRGLNSLMKQALGTVANAGDVRLNERTCSGWMCVPNNDDDMIDNWVVLSFASMTEGNVATVTMYENERELKKLDQFSCDEVIRTYQPRTQEMRMGNQFIVVLNGSRTLRFQARSTNAVKVWLHALCLSPLSL